MLYNQEDFDLKEKRSTERSTEDLYPQAPVHDMQLKHLQFFYALPLSSFWGNKKKADYILFMSVFIFLCYTTFAHTNFVSCV